MNMKSLRQSNKGFTLVELVVTMVIISVLASITTFSLIAWQHDSLYNKAEQNAELIFMAVRNKIAIYKANNALFEIDGMQDYDPNLVPGADTGSNSDGMSSTGKYNYLFCSDSDYKNYKDNNLPASSCTAKMLFEYVSPYIYDKTILNAYISVEFDKNTGDVVGVYYSERTKVYNKPQDVGNNTNGGFDISRLKDDESMRYDLLVGEYRP